MLKRVDYEGFEAFHLANEAIELVVVPEIGGKIVSLKRPDGREWLWRNPHLPQKRAAYGESFVEIHDTGGWDECFPTTNPCTLSNGVEIPDHGDLATQAWRIDECAPDRIGLSVDGVRLDYRFERKIALVPTGIEVSYRVQNRSEGDLPFLWCCHPLLAIEPGMSIDLPGSTPARLSYSATDDFHSESRFIWPELNGHDLSIIPSFAERHYGLKIFVGPLEDGRVALRNAGEELTFNFDQRVVSHVALWMNLGAWSGSGGEPYFNIGVGPCLGPFDSLSEALESTCSNPKIPVGEFLEWSLKVQIVGTS